MHQKQLWCDVEIFVPAVKHYTLNSYYELGYIISTCSSVILSVLKVLLDEFVWVFCFYVTYLSTVFQSYLQDCLGVAGSAMSIKTNKPV